MNETSIVVESLFDGEKYASHQRIVLDGARILRIEPVAENEPMLSGLLSAGFIDLQVNGGGGVLFNDSPDADSIAQIAKAHQTFGTSGWLPTLITDSLAKMKSAADAVAKAMLQPKNGVLGIHFEGPHLSVPKKGVHEEGFIRPLTEQEMQIFKRQDIGKVLVTVAPENVSPEQIKELVAHGVIVFIGHTNASFEQVEAAIRAGASGFTHLYNAMSQLNAREPGAVGAALVNLNCHYGIILDGVHMHPAAAQIAYRANPNMVLVTDAMPPVGCQNDEFSLSSGVVKREGNQLLDQQGRLAGSVLDMAEAVKNAQQILKINEIEAIKLATQLPARVIGLSQEYGRVKPGHKASLVLRNKKGDVTACWVDGIQVI